MRLFTPSLLVIPSLLALLLLPVAGQGEEAHSKITNTDDQEEWVVVFDDPRPARLQGWVRNDYGKASGDYRSSLELTRFSKRVAAKYGMDLRDEWYISSLGVYCLVVRFKDDQAEAMAKLKEDESVQWIQPSNEFELLVSSSGTPANVETAISKNSQLPNSMNGAGVTIAIVDSAVDDTHPDLTGAIQKNELFATDARDNISGEKHGTAIAGVMITQPHTKLGVTGIAPAATVHAYRGCWESTEDKTTNCSTLSLARALDAVIQDDADLLNLSLSGPRDALLDRLVQRLIDRGSLVVAAYDPNRTSSERFPKNREGVLIVRAEGLAGGNGRGFTAPGARVVPMPGNRYDFMQGHSIATAYTTGVFALRKQAFDSRENIVSNNRANDWRTVSDASAAQDLVAEILERS
ncbi:MAG: S8 family serine peptidase [Pseudomonadota bacterium]